jgi:hypothetical protein
MEIGSGDSDAESKSIDRAFNNMERKQARRLKDTTDLSWILRRSSSSLTSEDLEPTNL